MLKTCIMGENRQFYSISNKNIFEKLINFLCMNLLIMEMLLLLTMENAFIGKYFFMFS